MNNFKSGSGDLDFGGNKNNEDDTKDESAAVTDQADSTDRKKAVETPATEQQSSSTKPDGSDESTETVSDQSVAVDRPTTSGYPYFVRRNNVGDERDTRLEIHVRDKVAEGEAKFRNELAEQLETSNVSKTDAREFALLAAFRHPERVAELMEEEGFGTLG